MADRFKQAAVDRWLREAKAGTQFYDAEAKGLRLVVGSRGGSYKHLGRINRRGGRYVTVSIGRADEVSLRQARTASAEVRLALKRGEDPRRPASTVPTLQEALDRYLSREDLTPRTKEFYRQCVEGPLRSLRDTPMDLLGREEVRALHETITQRSGPYLANGAMRTLRALHNDAARSFDLPPNPVSRAVRFNREQRRDDAVAPEDMPGLWRSLEAVGCPIMRGAWLTLLLTGLRSGDVRAMRWEHIEDGVLLVPHPKGGRSFRLPLCAHLLGELEALRELGSEFVFPSPRDLSKPLAGIKRTKTFPFNPHAMRHNFSTHAMEAGVDHATLKLLLNHASGDVTFGYVTRAHLQGHMRDAVERVAARLLSYK
ncbi:tyrosine-type recombinase/integrase [Hyphomonas sp.]|uniref:tyrosine-type recombinase/integrase n=1 Tax=Hyphomonas sp. TaxID=87 RepID=UPI00391DFCA1